MSIFDPLFASNGEGFIATFAAELFESFACDSMVVAIADRNGNCWSSDAEAFCRMGLAGESLRQICGRVNDGAEPVISIVGNWGLVVAALSCGERNIGYAIIALEQHSPEQVLAKLDLIESVIGLINLNAKAWFRIHRMEQYCNKLVSMHAN
jgi:hypothetical protein